MAKTEKQVAERIMNLVDVIGGDTSFTDSVECPCCAVWFRASVTEPDEEVDVWCPNCGAILSISMVRYLVASDYA